MDEIFEGLLKGSKIRSIQIAGIFVGVNRVRKTGQVFQGVFFKTSKIYTLQAYNIQVYDIANWGMRPVSTLRRDFFEYTRTYFRLMIDKSEWRVSLISMAIYDNFKRKRIKEMRKGEGKENMKQIVVKVLANTFLLRLAKLSFKQSG